MSTSRFIVGLLLLVIAFPLASASQSATISEVEGRSRPGINRERGKKILAEIKDVLETHYYDKTFKGMDLEVKFKEARETINQLETNAQIFRVIAQLLLSFNDSHTRFYPPGRSAHIEYGFTIQIVGNDGFVVDVKNGSDAEKKGLKIGDRVTKIGQYPVNRESLWILNYLIYQLEPQMALPITVTDAGAEKPFTIVASLKTLADRRKEADSRRRAVRENPYTCVRLNAETAACKLRSFSVEKRQIDKMMTEAAGAKKLIIDLRGNRGGYVRTEEHLTGHFFEDEFKIAELVYRKKTRPSISKPVKDKQFKGEVIVLVDSNSASASEVFARTIQIRKRGLVMGDVTAGAVMTSYNMSLAIVRGATDFATVTPYGLNVTVADLIMSDGNRLERVGVVPDVLIGPTQQALRSKGDPILAIAAEKFGHKITSDDAGKLNFLFRPTESDDADDDDERDDEP